MRRAALLVTAVVLGAAAPAAHAASRLSVSNDRTAIATKLGHKFVFRSRIDNNGPRTAADLVAHLNVLDLTGHTYVDPEDWSSDRTRYMAPVPPGGSITLTWRMDAVNAGKIGIYVAVLPRSGAPTLRVDIRDRRTLNTGGILPLALGIPGVLGLLALSVRVRRGQYVSRPN
jgi:hypothetical protein